MTNESNIAFIFPGQGSQTVGMLSALGINNPIFEETFSLASEQLGFDLWQLTQRGPEAELNKTENTQPALLTAGVAVYRNWLQCGGVKPALLAGHSLGEYTALVCANVLSLTDAVLLVADRGKAMQSAVPVGTGLMAAILGLDDTLLETICEEAAAGQIVSPANFNSPGQVVIAGDKDAVERAMELAKKAGAKRALALPVSVPSHCALMLPAAEAFAERLQQIKFSDADIPVIQNVDVEMRTDAENIKTALLSQLHQPVRWTDTVLKIKSQGINKIVESGPGKVLSGLSKRIDRKLESISLNEMADLEKALSEA